MDKGNKDASDYVIKYLKVNKADLHVHMHMYAFAE